MNISPLLIPIVFIVAVPVTVIGVMLTRAFVRRLEQTPRRAELSPELAARLDRMEQAVEAIAVEVERISEGQRFTTRLLSERAEPPQLASGPNPARR
jgi:hypothetical protein